MKTRILKVKGDWEEVVDDCRGTVGKESLGREPSDAFKRRLLIAEHSTIRSITIKWIWRSIKSWIATHWSRHKWECFIKTQRSDRTGINRDELPQDAPVDFKGEANPQHLIDTWRKRLCRQASEETREYAEDFKVTLRPIEKEISDVLVPNCVYRGGCPEMKMTPCDVWPKFVEYCWGKGIAIGAVSIQTRYDLFNEWFYSERGE